jgi:nucleoid-associated protein YgaU
MISFFAKYNDRIVQLPVNPEDITISGSSSNDTTDTVGQGEISNIGFPGLKELTISSFFPKRYNGELYINTGGQFEEPEFYIKFFEDIKKDRKPFRLIITDLNINMLVSIESFSNTYAYGTDDVDYELELKEYKEHNIRILKATSTGFVNVDSVQKVSSVTPTNTNSNRSVEKSTPKTYTVVSEDNLWTIAQRLLGDGSRWNEIYSYNNNKSIIGGNPNLIRPGQVLSIPS